MPNFAFDAVRVKDGETGAASPHLCHEQVYQAANMNRRAGNTVLLLLLLLLHKWGSSCCQTVQDKVAWPVWLHAWVMFWLTTVGKGMPTVAAARTPGYSHSTSQTQQPLHVANHNRRHPEFVTAH